MHPTRNDLPVRSRGRLEKLLNQRLADALDLEAALGGTALGPIAAVARSSSLAPYPEDLSAGADHLAALADRLADFGRKVRAAIATAAKLADADTSDLFTAVSRDVDKYL